MVVAHGLQPLNHEQAARDRASVLRAGATAHVIQAGRASRRRVQVAGDERAEGFHFAPEAGDRRRLRGELLPQVREGGLLVGELLAERHDGLTNRRRHGVGQARPRD
jgi:hypothetical protein